MNRARNHAADAGNQRRFLRDRHDARRSADDVDHVADLARPRRWRPSAHRTRPTGIGIPGRRPSFWPTPATSARPWHRWWRSVLRSFARYPSAADRLRPGNSSGGKPPHLRIPHPLVAHGAYAARDHCRIVQIPQSTAAAMSQCSSAAAIRSRLSGLFRSQCSSLEKPHSDE